MVGSTQELITQLESAKEGYNPELRRAVIAVARKALMTGTEGLVAKAGSLLEKIAVGSHDCGWMSNEELRAAERMCRLADDLNIKEVPEGW